jgi:pimeloyl-ACP methyl ester carboxylesterase
MRGVRGKGLLLLLAAGGLTAGCGLSFGPRARYGITFYCPGAGNYDMGDVNIRRGLEAAGYRGQVATFLWTMSFNPAIDQIVRINPILRSRILARYIRQYREQYPDQPVHVIGLSAGTGVAMWAIEALPEGCYVDNVVLLASSLSRGFDAGKALRRIRGCIYVYYSPNDAVLSLPMRVTGTIDGVFTQDPAGLVGLYPPGGPHERIVNIPWRPEFEKLGYYGGHTDCTSPRFVQAEIAPRLMAVRRSDPASDGTSYASRRESAPPGVPAD